MDDPATGRFDGAAAIFSEHATTRRGHVRYKLVQRHLEPFLGKKSLRVLDVGGGSGIDTAWLAYNGHHVTLIEPSREQYLYAERRFNFFLNAEERARITMLDTPLDGLKSKLASFDLVLMHGVAMYQDDPEAFIASVAAFVKPGGYFSLLEKGYYGAEDRAKREGKTDQLKRLHDTRRILNSLDLDVYAFLPEELETVLVRSGLEVIQWAGLRPTTDHLNNPVTDYDSKTLETIVDNEFIQSIDTELRSHGQLLHFIARRP